VATLLDARRGRELVSPRNESDVIRRNTKNQAHKKEALATTRLTTTNAATATATATATDTVAATASAKAEPMFLRPGDTEPERAAAMALVSAQSAEIVQPVRQSLIGATVVRSSTLSASLRCSALLCACTPSNTCHPPHPHARANTRPHTHFLRFFIWGGRAHKQATAAETAQQQQQRFASDIAALLSAPSPSQQQPSLSLPLPLPFPLRLPPPPLPLPVESPRMHGPPAPKESENAERAQSPGLLAALSSLASRIILDGDVGNGSTGGSGGGGGIDGSGDASGPLLHPQQQQQQQQTVVPPRQTMASKRRRDRMGKRMRTGSSHEALARLHRDHGDGNANPAVVCELHSIRVAGLEAPWRRALIAGPGVRRWLMSLQQDTARLVDADGDGDNVAVAMLEKMSGRVVSAHMAVLQRTAATNKRGQRSWWDVVAVLDSNGLHAWDPLRILVHMHPDFAADPASALKAVAAHAGKSIEAVAQAVSRDASLQATTAAAAVAAATSTATAPTTTTTTTAPTTTVVAKVDDIDDAGGSEEEEETGGDDIDPPKRRRQGEGEAEVEASARSSGTPLTRH